MKRSLLWILGALLLQACQVDKKDPRQRHVAPPAAQADHSVQGQSKTYHGLELEALYKRSQGAASDVERIAMIRQIGGIMFSPRNLVSPDFKAERRTKWALSFMNAQIMALRDRRPVADILTTYRPRLFEGCEGDGLDKCRHLEFFKQDPQTSAILKILAVGESTVTLYYRDLKLAYDLKNGTADAELNSLLSARLLDWLKLHVDAIQDGDYTRLTLKDLAPERKKKFVEFNTFLAMVIRDANASTGPQAAELFRWLSSDRLAQMIGQELTEAILRQISTRFEDPEVWAEFLRVFAREERDQDTSYSQALKRLRKYPGVLKNLGVDIYDLEAEMNAKSKKLAGMLYLSRLYDLRSPSREKYLLRISGLEPMDFLKMMDAFVRVTLVDRAMRTHEKMAGFYKKYEHDGRARQELLGETVRFANQNLTSDWRDYVNRIQQIENVFQDDYGRPLGGETNTPLGQRVRDVKNLFLQLNPTIKYMVTYPNQTMMAYYAAKLNLEMKIAQPGGKTFQITRNVIAHELMEGGFPPLMQFTAFRANESDRDRESIDSVQVMWSLYYTMTMNVPSAYGVSMKDFLSTFFANYKIRTDEQIRETIEQHRAMFVKNSDIDNLLGLCRKLQPPYSPEPHALEIAQLDRVVFRGSIGSEAIAPLRTAVLRTNLSGKALRLAIDESLEILRSDIDPKLRRLAMLRNTLAQLPNPDQAALGEIDRQMAESVDLRDTVLASSRRLITELPDCMLKMQTAEDTRRMELHQMEIGYLRRVRQALEAWGAGPAALAALKNSDAFFSDLNLDVTPAQALNSLFADKTGLAAAFARTKEYRSDYLQNAGFRLNGSGRPQFIYRKLDVLMPVAGFMTQGFEGRKMPTFNDRLTINYPVSMRTIVDSDKSLTRPATLFNNDEAQFIRDAMVHFGGWTTWFRQDAISVHVMRTLLRQLVALLKLDFLGGINPEPLLQRRQQFQAQMQSLLDLNFEMLSLYNLDAAKKALLSLYPARSFFNLTGTGSRTAEGPTYLYTYTTNGDNNPSAFADDIFGDLTSIQLGGSIQFRNLRPYEENQFTGKHAGGGRSDREDKKTEADLIVRPNAYEKSAKYFLSLRDHKDLVVFPIHEGVRRQIEDYHTAIINSDAQMYQLFLESLNVWAAKNPPLVVQFGLDRAPVRIGMITPSLVRAYEAQMNQWHKERAGYFRLSNM